MHYIAGTRFTLTPNKHLSLYDKFFKQNVIYTVRKINRSNTGVSYIFDTSEGEKLEVIFKSCREADKIISLHRGESVPNYDEKYEMARGSF